MSDTTFGEVLELVHPTAESTTLAGMMADTESAIQIAQELEPSDFHNERYGVIFEAMRSLLLGVEPIDKPAIVAECRQVIQDRKLKLRVDESHLVFDGDPKRALNYALTVKRLAWLRSAAGFAHWMIQELQTGPDPDDLYTEAQERWTAIKPAKKSTSFVYGWDTLDMCKIIHQEMTRPKDEAGLRFAWPWRSWNQVVRPLLPGMVGIVAAPDGQGKTTYLEMVAEHWAMLGAQVVYVHLEDDLGYKKDRRMARYAQVAMETVEDNTYTKEDLHRVEAAEENMGQWAGNLHYYHAPGKSMVEIVRELETRVSEGVCQAVVFDYLDKTQPTRAQAKRHGGTSWERQADDMEQR
jgi:replicative DNA helicase